MSPLTVLKTPPRPSPAPQEREPPPRLPILSAAGGGALSCAPAQGRVGEGSSTRLVDAFGRRLTYLRVSVTDRCNLRCTYCLPADMEFPFGDRAFLSPAE